MMKEDHVDLAGAGGAGELSRRGETLVRSLCHGPAHDLVETAREPRNEITRTRRGRRQMSKEHLVLVASRVWLLACQALVEQAPEGIDVGPPIEDSTPDLLRGETPERSGPSSAGCLLAGDGQAEVGEIGVLSAVGPGDEDVRRLDVAVDEAERMRRVERVGDLPDDPHGETGREAAPIGDELSKGRALDEAHRHEEAPGILTGSVDRQRMRMLQRRGGERLAGEPGPEALQGGEVRRDQLQRDGAPELGIEGAVDDPHAPDTGDGLDQVSADLLAGRQQGGACGRGARAFRVSGVRRSVAPTGHGGFPGGCPHRRGAFRTSRLTERLYEVVPRGRYCHDAERSRLVLATADPGPGSPGERRCDPTMPRSPQPSTSSASDGASLGQVGRPCPSELRRARSIRRSSESIRSLSR